MNNTDTNQHEDPTTQEILNELKTAYKSINSLQRSATHRKIALELEQKIRKLQKAQSETKPNK